MCHGWSILQKYVSQCVRVCVCVRNICHLYPTLTHPGSLYNVTFLCPMLSLRLSWKLTTRNMIWNCVGLKMPFCFETFSARPESSPKLPPSHSGCQVPQHNLYSYGWLFKSCRASPALGNNPEDSIHCGGHLLNSGNCFPQPISAGEEGPQALTINIHPTLLFWFSSKIRGEVGRDKSYDIDGAKNSRHRTERGIPWAWIPPRTVTRLLSKNDVPLSNQWSTYGKWIILDEGFKSLGRTWGPPLKRKNELKRETTAWKILWPQKSLGNSANIIQRPSEWLGHK